MINSIKNMLSDLAGPAQLNNMQLVPAIDILGPSLQILHSLNDQASSHCIMLVSVPPGVTVPLHSHADPESIYVTAGTVDMLDRHAGATWQQAGPGDFIHIAPDSQHAFRNVTDAPAAFLCATTPRMAQFFEAVGEPVALGAAPEQPDGERIKRFLTVAKSFGYWIGSPEDNATSGIELSPPA